MLPRALLAWLLTLASVGAGAADILQVALPGDRSIEIERYAGSGAGRLLWLPSERGLGEAQRVHAAALAATGFEVWLADLHSAYFIERGRASIARFPLDDVVAIVAAAAAGADGRLLLIGASRGAQLALVAAREWQLRHPGSADIAGLLLIHPYLYAERPAATEAAAYLPVVDATNLPIYLLDAQFSTGTTRLGELAERLGDGGAPVYTQIVTGAQGGFYQRDDADLDAAELALKESFPALVRRAAALLQSTDGPRRAGASARDTRVLTAPVFRPPGLRALDRAVAAPRLKLARHDGGEYDLAARRGRVQLVNFWASWCRPCVREIPSLHRLHARVAHPDFDVVTVNIGEDRARIERFLERVPIELPLLLDRAGDAARDWRVYVYPSNYLVDRSGTIRYAYLGALEWDSAENLAIIRGLLEGR